ncbi:Flp family type IVb pilin [Pilimelia columellifera]|uniref:Flp family type IVb pilin n=1 Tax=Pilimelia columellifera subsp. columellifera TaxID=706583 RepID=A0ABN3N0U2_9ACTN
MLDAARHLNQQRGAAARRDVRPTDPTAGGTGQMSTGSPPRPRSDRGATAAEYVIIASLIAAVIALTVALFGEQVAELFQRAVDGFNS